MKLNFNHFDSFSTVDYPKRVCCMVFFNECNFRCINCHNKQTWKDKNYIDVNIIKSKILESKPLIHTVVFSGGEPTYQLKPLIELCKFSKENGFTVGIETNGYNTKGIMKLKPYVDLFMVDIKAPIDNDDLYYMVTHSYSASNIRDSLKLDIPLEIRIVNFNQEKTDNIIKSLPNNSNIKILSINKKVI